MRSRTISIGELLPYDAKCTFRKLPEKINFLKLLQFIAVHSGQAVISFLGKKYEHFDAHVGDTCCQVRAYYVNYLANKLQEPIFKQQLVDEFNEVIDLIKKITGIIEELELKFNNRVSHYDKFLDSNDQLNTLLVKFNVDFSFSEPMAFLITAFMLCAYAGKDSDGIPYGMDIKKMMESSQFSTTLIKKIIQKFQQCQSLLSCNFLIALLNADNSYRPEKTILPLLKKDTDEGRVALPCFEGMKLILNDIQCQEVVVVLIVKHTASSITKQILVGFYYDKNQSKEIIEINLSKLPDKKPCIVMHGICETSAFEPISKYISKLKHHGIANILLANMAKHPQFPGIKLNHLKENPYAEIAAYHYGSNEVTLSTEILTVIRIYVAMRFQAETIGACKENPSLFYIKHIFCSSISTIKLWAASQEAHGLFKNAG